MAKAERGPNRYAAIMAALFREHYRAGSTGFEFSRDEFALIARSLRIDLPKNLGDAIYSFRFRNVLPGEVTATAPAGMEWVIELAGRGHYRFALSAASRILPREGLRAIKIPDATPEIVLRYRLTDEQALLACVRYNRLIDIFMGITSYSLQNHLRTTVKGIGQIEIDEVYAAVNRTGQQFIVPVQAKGGSDRLGPTQTKQDVAWCRQRYPMLTCRPVSAQFMDDDVIAMFELSVAGETVEIIEEKHYKLVPSAEIQPEEIASYARG